MKKISARKRESSKRSVFHFPSTHTREVRKKGKFYRKGEFNLRNDISKLCYHVNEEERKGKLPFSD